MAYDYGSFDFSPEYDLYDQSEMPDYASQMPDMSQMAGAGGGGFDWGNYMSDYSNLGADQPTQMGGNDVSGISEYGGTSVGTSAVPSSVSEGRGFMPNKNQEEDWMDRLKKAGMGMGVGLATQGLSGMLGRMMTPTQPQEKLPQMATPTGAQYTPEPLAPRPGTQASPLIKPRPTSVKISQGLEERKPGYGGFSMY